MSDEHFWHVYFTLVRKHLPERAFTWTSSDDLPDFTGAAAGWGGWFLSKETQLRWLCANGASCCCWWSVCVCVWVWVGGGANSLDILLVMFFPGLTTVMHRQCYCREAGGRYLLAERLGKSADAARQQAAERGGA